MKIIFKITFNTFVFFIGVCICYWASLQWFQSGFQINSIYELTDGDGAFFMILFGLAFMAYGVLENIGCYYLFKLNKKERANQHNDYTDQ